MYIKRVMGSLQDATESPWAFRDYGALPFLRDADGNLGSEMAMLSAEV